VTRRRTIRPARAARTAGALLVLAGAAGALTVAAPGVAHAQAAGAGATASAGTVDVRVLGPRATAIVGAQVSITPVRATPGLVLARGGTTGDDGRSASPGSPTGRRRSRCAASATDRSRSR
jgi:hypothetical protein